jgi:hypothetical protein
MGPRHTISTASTKTSIDKPYPTCLNVCRKSFQHLEIVIGDCVAMLLAAARIFERKVDDVKANFLALQRKAYRAGSDCSLQAQIQPLTPWCMAIIGNGPGRFRSECKAIAVFVP